MNRKVTVYEWFREEGCNSTDPYKKRKVGVGVFHDFGLDYQHLDSGVGVYSTAIVEMLSGEVKSMPVDLIVFNNPITEEEK